MDTSINSALAFLFLIFIHSGCSNNQQCTMKTQVLPLNKVYRNWFHNVPGNNINFKSKMGLSECFYFDNYLGLSYNEFPTPDPCTNYKSEQNYISYSSTLYNFSLIIYLSQNLDGPDFSCKTTGIYNSKEITSYLNKNLQTGSVKRIFVSASYEDSLTAYIPKFEVIDSVTSGNNTFLNVYKVTNTFMEDLGDHFSITEMYIDENSDLIKFIQKNGDVWELK